MKLFPALVIGLFIITSAVAETDFDKAIQKAKQEHKLILLRFSGSDWCVPCIRMNKEVFENNIFKTYADSNLVLVIADFPRLKKNRLPDGQQKMNDKLAEKYNSPGNFPFTVLADENGNVLKTWEGYTNMTPDQFVNQLKNFTDARK